MHKYKKSIFESEKEKHIEKTKKLYQGYLNELSIPTNIEKDIKVYTTSDWCYSDNYKPTYNDEFDEYEPENVCYHHFIAIIVTFRKKKFI